MKSSSKVIASGVKVSRHQSFIRYFDSLGVSALGKKIGPVFFAIFFCPTLLQGCGSDQVNTQSSSLVRAPSSEQIGSYGVSEDIDQNDVSDRGDGNTDSPIAAKIQTGMVSEDPTVYHHDPATCDYHASCRLRRAREKHKLF